MSHGLLWLPLLLAFVLLAALGWLERRRQSLFRAWAEGAELVKLDGSGGAQLKNGRLVWCRFEAGKFQEHGDFDVCRLELVELKTSESCCGFGGTFSIKSPEISTAMLDHKLDELAMTPIDVLAAVDSSCLMQIRGRLERRGSPVRTMHLAEILASR